MKKTFKERQRTYGLDQILEQEHLLERQNQEN